MLVLQIGIERSAEGASHPNAVADALFSSQTFLQTLKTALDNLNMLNGGQVRLMPLLPGMGETEQKQALQNTVDLMRANRDVQVLVRGEGENRGLYLCKLAEKQNGEVVLSPVPDGFAVNLVFPPVIPGQTADEVVAQVKAKLEPYLTMDVNKEQLFELGEVYNKLATFYRLDSGHEHRVRVEMVYTPEGGWFWKTSEHMVPLQNANQSPERKKARPPKQADPQMASALGGIKNSANGLEALNRFAEMAKTKPKEAAYCVEQSPLFGVGEKLGLLEILKQKDPLHSKIYQKALEGQKKWVKLNFAQTADGILGSGQSLEWQRSQLQALAIIAEPSAKDGKFRTEAGKYFSSVISAINLLYVKDGNGKPFIWMENNSISGTMMDGQAWSYSAQWAKQAEKSLNALPSQAALARVIEMSPYADMEQKIDLLNARMGSSKSAKVQAIYDNAAQGQGAYAGMINDYLFGRISEKYAELKDELEHDARKEWAMAQGKIFQDKFGLFETKNSVIQLPKTMPTGPLSPFAPENIQKHLPSDPLKAQAYLADVAAQMNAAEARYRILRTEENMAQMHAPDFEGDKSLQMHFNSDAGIKSDTRFYLLNSAMAVAQMIDTYKKVPGSEAGIKKLEELKKSYQNLANGVQSDKLTVVQALGRVDGLRKQFDVTLAKIPMDQFVKGGRATLMGMEVDSEFYRWMVLNKEPAGMVLFGALGFVPGLNLGSAAYFSYLAGRDIGQGMVEHDAEKIIMGVAMGLPFIGEAMNAGRLGKAMQGYGKMVSRTGAGILWASMLPAGADIFHDIADGYFSINTDPGRIIPLGMPAFISITAKSVNAVSQFKSGPKSGTGASGSGTGTVENAVAESGPGTNQAGRGQGNFILIEPEVKFSVEGKRTAVNLHPGIEAGKENSGVQDQKPAFQGNRIMINTARTPPWELENRDPIPGIETGGPPPKFGSGTGTYGIPYQDPRIPQMPKDVKLNIVKPDFDYQNKQLDANKNAVVTKTGYAYEIVDRSWSHVEEMEKYGIPPKITLDILHADTEKAVDIFTSVATRSSDQAGMLLQALMLDGQMSRASECIRTLQGKNMELAKKMVTYLTDRDPARGLSLAADMDPRGTSEISQHVYRIITASDPAQGFELGQKALAEGNFVLAAEVAKELVNAKTGIAADDVQWPQKAAELIEGLSIAGKSTLAQAAGKTLAEAYRVSIGTNYETKGRFGIVDKKLVMGLAEKMLVNQKFADAWAILDNMATDKSQIKDIRIDALENALYSIDESHPAYKLIKSALDKLEG